ncbi:hypothetical protein AOCH_006360, partial [Aspergillus ochraceoroseus]
QPSLLRFSSLYHPQTQIQTQIQNLNLNSSPTQTPPPPPPSTDTDTDTNTNTNTNTNTTTNQPRIATPTPTGTRPTHLTCYIAPSHHNHESALKRNPFYTRFELDQSSAIYRDLVENTGIPRPELADVPTARKEFLPMNDRKRAHYSTVRMGGGSLMGLYRDGAARAQRRKGSQGEGGLHGREGEGEEVFEDGDGNEKGKAKKVSRVYSS